MQETGIRQLRPLAHTPDPARWNGGATLGMKRFHAVPARPPERMPGVRLAPSRVHYSVPDAGETGAPVRLPRTGQISINKH